MLRWPPRRCRRCDTLQVFASSTAGAARRDRQRDELCDALAAVPPDAPTSCGGWDAHDLAVHVWILGHDPWSWPGMARDRWASQAAARMRRIKADRAYRRLIDDLRRGSGALACMPLDFVGCHRHALGEYFVHTRDVTRPNQLVESEPTLELETALWLRLRRAAPLLHRRQTPGLVLEWPGVGSRRVRREPPRLVVRGRPSELILWTYGRLDSARVEVLTVDESGPT